MKEKVGLIVDKCIICQSQVEATYDEKLDLTFYRCLHCEFVHQDPTTHVDGVKEKEQYDFHDNSFENEGYVDYLTKFMDSYVVPLNKAGAALDFGSGPGPVLSELLKKHFELVLHYDPYYHPDESYKKKTFDVITSTEVAEHFSDPLKEFRHLKSLLREDGYLVIMTSFRTMDMEEFLGWWYRRDSTHISFYRVKTFEEIARQLGLKIVSHNEKNVIILKRA